MFPYHSLLRRAFLLPTSSLSALPSPSPVQKQASVNCCALFLTEWSLLYMLPSVYSPKKEHSRETSDLIVTNPVCTAHSAFVVLCCASCSVVSNSLRCRGLWPARLLCPWGFSRQEYCSGSPCPPPGDLPNPGTEPRSPTLQADSLLSEPLSLYFH